MANLTPVGVQAVVENLNGFLGDLGKMNTSVQNVGGQFADVGKTLATGAIVTGIGAVTAAIGGLAAVSKVGLDSLMGWGEQLDRLGDQFGMTGEQASKWTVAMNKVGLSVEEGGQGLNYFTKNLDNVKTDMGAATGTISPFQKALSALSINAFDANGNVRSLDDVMPEIMDKFQKLPAGVNSSALAMDLFGARGGTKFLDFLRQGSAGLSDAEKMAKAFGLEMSTDGMNAIEGYGFALSELNLGLTGIKNQIGKAVLPYARQFVEWAKGAVPMVVQLAAALGEKLGAGLQVIANLVGAFQAGGFTGLASALGISPETQGFIANLISGIAELANTINGVLAQAFTWLNTNGLPMLNQAIAFVVQNWDAFQGALIGIGVILGGAVIVGGIAAIAAAIASLITPVGLIIAAAALLGAAWNTNFLGMRDALTAFWAQAQPVIEQLGLWLQTNLPVAIQALAAFWNGTLLPALQATGTFIMGTVIPALAQVGTWLATNIPAAIQTAASFWNGTLLPAMQAVGNWANAYLLPAFMALNNFIGAVLSLTLTAMAGLWQNVLYPALLAVYNFLSAQLTPGLTATGNVISTVLGPAVQFFVDNILLAFQQGLLGIQNALTWVTDQLNVMTGALNNVQLPDWLKPGSPTPFEIGLRGIADTLSGKVAKAMEGFAATAPSVFRQLADTITQIKTDLTDMAENTLIMFGEAINSVGVTMSGMGSAAASAFSVLNKSIDNALDAVEELDNTLSGVGGEAREAANAFDSFQDAGRGIYDTLIPALRSLLNILEDIADAAADAADNIGAIPESPPGTAGGMGFQAGVRNFVVPPGFPNDTYPVRLSTGEKMTVIPRGQAAGASGGNVTVNLGPVTISGELDLQQFGDFVERRVAMALGA